MSDNKTVKDVMVGIFEYPHIPYWFSISQAMRIVKVTFLRSKKYLEPMVILIFDEKYNFMGTVTLKDILNGVEPKCRGGQISQEDDHVWNSLFRAESIGLAEKPVRDILEPAKFFVDPGDPIEKAACLMLANDLVLLPVLEEKKKFVGLVRMLEMFDEISTMLLDGPQK